MIQFVLDCSISISGCFLDGKNPYAMNILNNLDNNQQVIVPSLWYTEIANVLLVGLRKKRLTLSDLQKYLTLVTNLPIVLDEQPIMQSMPQILHLAQLYDLTAYDAGYLEVAMILGIPIATLDNDLVKAARIAEVPLMSI